MDADTLSALTTLSQRVAVLEASSAAVTSAANVAQIQANAQAVQNAQQLAEIQEQAILTAQARQAAMASIYHPNYAPPPGWRPGMPYPH